MSEPVNHHAVSDEILDRAIAAMRAVFAEVPIGVDHTLNVVRNARLILDGERVAGVDRLVTLLSAVLHDIGAVEAQRKHGSMDGRLQELEGPAIARAILVDAGADPSVIERVCFIVGRHHTRPAIDGLDFQIVWEADRIEALAFETGTRDPEKLARTIVEEFRTETGRALAASRLERPLA